MTMHPLFAGILASTLPPTGHRFQTTSCSQCGKEFGPGNHGYSHCEDHIAAAITNQMDPGFRALLRDLADFLYMAGNQLCDDDHSTLANVSGMLLKRVQRELEG